MSEEAHRVRKATGSHRRLPKEREHLAHAPSGQS